MQRCPGASSSDLCARREGLLTEAYPPHQEDRKGAQPFERHQLPSEDRQRDCAPDILGSRRSNGVASPQSTRGNHKELEMDRLSSEERSALMARVRRHGTGAEDALADLPRGEGLKYETQRRDLPGTPDVVIPRYRLILFADGDFWHGRLWFDRGIAPETDSEAWIRKFERNRERDRLVDGRLGRRGWSCSQVLGEGHVERAERDETATSSSAWQTEA